MQKQEIQEAVVAGSFYPAQEKSLREQVAGYLEQAENQGKLAKLVGLISPHAGYIYSGEIAAYAYRQLRGESYAGVVILAPSHFAAMDGVSFLDKKYYRTPLGLIPLDQERIIKLRRVKNWLFYEPRLYRREHSLEVQLPFLQSTLEGFKLITLVLGNSDYNLCQELADLLFELFGNDNLLYIASSDLSHYQPYEEAKSKDAYTLELIKNLDSASLLKEAFCRRAELCGLGPVLTLMELFKKQRGKRVNILKYANSGDTSGSKTSVVGYGAVGFIK